MKNTKKLISLILVMLLCLSLIPFAGAKAFTDTDTDPVSENYQSAVDTLSELNIIAGYDDGGFHPKAELTRAQYLKMLYVIINSGNDDKGASYKGISVPFTDVNSGSWYEGYVKYAYDRGWIAGKTATIFDPNGNVTGLEALKLSLVALDYNQDTEGFTGKNWNVEVSNRAQEAGLLFYLETEEMSVPINREVAAQMLYNTLLAQMVTYSPGLIKGDTMAYAYYKLENFSGARALEYANIYSAFGLHRTGTEAEITSTKWITQELTNAGLTTELQEIRFNRFDLTECRVVVGGKEIASFPFWFPVSTNGKAVEAEIVAFNEEDPTSMAGKIVYYNMPGLQSNANIAPIAAKAKESGALAVISTVTHPNGYPAAQNAVGDYAEEPLALPCVIISSTEKAYVEASIAENAAASVLIGGTVIPDSIAYNVIGKIDNNADKWVIVTTPISGWFVCNAERGGGVGLFLELAKSATTWDKSVNYVFMGNSGHELNFLGSHYSEEYAPAPENVKVWIHLGSGIAATEPIMANYKFLGFSENIAEQATAAFKGVTSIVIQSDQEKLMQSELGSFISKGYTAMGLYGANKHFHTEADIENGISGSELAQLGEDILIFLKGYLSN